MATSIRFTSSGSNEMRYGAGVSCLGAYSFLIVLKIISGTTWQSYLEQESTIGTHVSLGRHSSLGLYVSHNAGLTQNATNTVQAADGWMIIAATRPAGAAQTVSLHKIVVGGSRVTGSGDATLGNETTTVNALRIGGNDDFADIEVACAAIWAGTALTTGQLDGINTAKTSQSILDLSPTWMVDASDGLVSDQVGSLDRTAVTGTSAGASDPTGWVYLGAGAAPKIPRVVLPPYRAA